MAEEHSSSADAGDGGLGLRCAGEVLTLALGETKEIA